MPAFYFPECHLTSTKLPEEESRHALKSLRLNEKNEIKVLNGKGDVFKAIITSVSKKELSFEILEHISAEKLTPELHVAISPLKQADRFEFFIEKATEMGIKSITPLICDRTEKPRININRLERIMISALKQSGNPYMPVLNEAISFKNHIPTVNTALKVMGYCEQEDKKENLNSINFDYHTTALIGPEGDFTKEELDTAIKHGFMPISMGALTLRTETAGIAFCSIFHLNRNH